MKTIHSPVIILGSGPAGYTAAIYAARAKLNPLLITGETFGGQLTTTSDVENWPADVEGLQGPALMGRFHEHAQRFDTQFALDHVHTAHIDQRPFVLEGNAGRYSCDALIIATGASAMYLGLESEKAFLGSGVSGCATCDGYAFQDKDVVVVGGGNTAVEEALYMTHIARKVTVVHRRDRFRAEPILIDRLMDKVRVGKVVIKWNHVVEEIQGDADGVNAVLIRGIDLSGPETVPASGVFIAIGHRPNTKLFRGLLEMRDGYILTRAGLAGMATATSVPGIFAAGDVQDSVYRQAITSAGTGCMAALDAQRYLERHTT